MFPLRYTYRNFSTFHQCSNKSSFLTSFLQSGTNFSKKEIIIPLIEKNKSSTDSYGKDDIFQKAVSQIDKKVRFHKDAGLKIKDESYESLKTWMKWYNHRKTTFIAIDVEVFELRHEVPLEVGILIIDFENQKYSPFPNFLNLHFIIDSKHRNGNYVPDNMHRFLNGFSYKIDRTELKDILMYILQKYGYCDEVSEIPKVAIVGHSFKSDIAFFKKAFGLKLNNNVPIIDIHQVWKMTFEEKIMKKSRLSYMLRKLNIPSVYLHNGANDAYFSLIALMKLLDPEQRVNLYCKNYDDLYDNQNTFLMSILKPEDSNLAQKQDVNSHSKIMDKFYKFNIYDTDLEKSLVNKKKNKPAPNNYFFGVRNLAATRIKSLLNEYWNTLK